MNAIIENDFRLRLYTIALRCFGKYFGKENIYKIYLVLMFISKGKRSQYWGVQYRLNSTKYSSTLNEKYW